MMDIRNLVLWIVALSATFSLTMTAESKQISELRYWFGNDQHPTTISARAGESIQIPYSQSKRNVVVVLNYQVKDIEGNWSVPHRHYFLPPKNSSVFPDNLTLTLTSQRGKVEKQNTISKRQTDIDIDVKDLDPGIYKMTGTVVNPLNGELIGITNSFVNITPYGGNSLEGIYYWLNDSVAYMSRQDGKRERIPLTKTVNIPIDSKKIPSYDNKLTINDGKAEIAPNYTISVAFRNSSGFIADSTAWITDNSRRRELLPLWLEASKQHDNEGARSDTCYWYAFKAQKDDVIDFSARRPCRIKLYDPIASLLDTALFTDNKKVLQSKINKSGTHYIQVSEIEQSRQIFSTMLEFISGPTADELNRQTGDDEHSHDGLLLAWDNASAWKNIDNGVSFSKNGIDIKAINMSGYLDPYIAAKSGQCRVYPGNVIQLNSKNYIEKAVFCVKNVSDIELPRFESPNGNVAIDPVTKCIEWSGLSEQVELSLSKSQTDYDAVLPITKVYVTLSDLTHEDVTFDYKEYEGIDDTPFNMLYVWGEGKLLASHVITESTRLFVDNDSLTVNCDNQISKYTLDHNVVLTYEYSDNPDVGSVEVIETVINGDGIMFNSLPAFVGIYSVNGQTYFAKFITDPDFVYPLDKLNPGVYIIRVGDKVSKIMIK